MSFQERGRKAISHIQRFVSDGFIPTTNIRDVLLDLMALTQMIDIEKEYFCEDNVESMSSSDYLKRATTIKAFSDLLDNDVLWEFITVLVIAESEAVKCSTSKVIEECKTVISSEILAHIEKS